MLASAPMVGVSSGAQFDPPGIFGGVLWLSLAWLAVFKMMHRSGGRQGCGQLLTALASFSSTLRSLTVTGPARTFPRPFGHP